MSAPKSAKKFQKKHLKRVIDQRKVEQQYKKKIQQSKLKKQNEKYVDEEAEERKKRKKEEDARKIFEKGDAEKYFNRDIDEDLEILNQEPKDLEKSSSKKSKKLSKLQDDMKQSLDELKDKDPEFYKYLKQNDKELLDFNPEDLSEGNDDDDEEGSDSEGGELESAPSDVDDDYDEVMQDEDLEVIEVTPAKVSEWEATLNDKNSISTLKEVILAFKDAINASSNFGESSSKYVISNPDVFNGLLKLALVQVPETIQHHLPLSTSSTGAKFVSGENKKLAVLSVPMKTLAGCLVTILEDVQDNNVAGLVLKSLNDLIPYFLTFRKQIKAQIDVVSKLWGTTQDDETRMYSFAFLQTAAKNYSTALLEPILKSTYSVLIKYSRQSNVHTMGGINFQKNSAASLYGIDPTLSYKLGFQYIRQLAVHLRSSLTNKTPDAYKVVYNWQFVHSLDFWSRVLSFECEVEKTALRGSQSPLQELIYPLVQVTLGTIRLIPTTQYFPLRFYLIRSLLRLSQATGVYIPIVPLITEIFSSTVITKVPKGTAIVKPIDFDYTIRASKSYLDTKVYQDGVCEQIIDLLGEFFVLHCKSIAFPELAVPVSIALKRFTKRNTKNGKFNKQILRFVERLEANSKFIQQKRSKVEFGPTNRAEVAVFLKDYEWQKTPLGSYVVVQRQVREERLKLLREAAVDDSKHTKKKAVDLNVGTSFDSDDDEDDAHDRSDVEYSSDDDEEEKEKE